MLQYLPTACREEASRKYAMEVERLLKEEEEAAKKRDALVAREVHEKEARK